MLDFLPPYLLPIVGAAWLIGFLMCMLNAYVPERDGLTGTTRMTRRTKARLILTGWFFPLAAPIWIAVFLYLAVVLIATSLYDNIRTAFSRSDGGKV